ncbi:MAG: hypothetical protein ACYDA8_12745, partial [Deferrisomatales bacterium]
DDRSLELAHSRRALASLRRFAKRREADRAAATGRQWLIDAARAQGIDEAGAEALVQTRALAGGVAVGELYRRVCLGDEDIAAILGSLGTAPRRRGSGALLGRLRGREDLRRKVRRYDFDDSHIRFCPACTPVEGDEIEGVPDQGRLLVHRTGCARAVEGGRIPLTWDRSDPGDHRDPGAVEMAVAVEAGPGVLYSLLTPFKDLGLDVRHLKLPTGHASVSAEFQPGSARTLDRLIRALRKNAFVREIRVFRAVG